ncbi:3'(2'),5'-bisphosphate nucleotidase CysQ [Vreelandella subglaciescola]|jgi:3'(2'), 5'-bisphosphate nucleotidase|uniref:3'(2'),5'-bisphosphate nucleotidase CysQ n=1 Tax=Vreelandella subglaciescola TaxID=29571 RepID=A0A1M7GRS7_9GAMM|nr:3'(2'),5'-bisphosphate nucleotidase CysQ [Halomonas subglaciescola]SHM18901.1 3'(2'),5'-bisphosphate nucleotidase [Halomonas subglaciescola]
MTWIDQTLLSAVTRIARDAGEAIMDVYARGFSVTEKADHSPLTEADLAAHRVIVAGLAALPEAIPILSEEDAGSFSRPDAQARYWLVDPLDGTKEFIKRNDEFTVNIALIERGRPVLGVVLVPVTGVAYVAAAGLGAHKIHADGKCVAISVAGRPAAGATWRVMGSRSHAGVALAGWLETLGAHELTPVGSSLKSCLIAEGRADVYPRLGPTSLWDTGAAQAVLEQAGGRVVDLAGESLDYADPAQTLNPSFVAWGF